MRVAHFIKMGTNMPDNFLVDFSIEFAARENEMLKGSGVIPSPILILYKFCDIFNAAI